MGSDVSDYTTHLYELRPVLPLGKNFPESISLLLRSFQYIHTNRTQGRCLKGMKDTLPVTLTLSERLLDEVMLGLQLCDQASAFQKLLLFL